MNIVKKLKSKLLTHLFVEWVKTSDDLEALNFSKDLIQSRVHKVNGHKPIMGFRTHSNDIS